MKVHVIIHNLEIEMRMKIVFFFVFEESMK
jgi:hypothetical protein